MNLFDTLVSQATKNQEEFFGLQSIVEKELLHHDIMREMSMAGLLHNLTFMGGTCLRDCYGSNRLSEDLDFTGGNEFKRETLRELGAVLVDRLFAKYGLHIEMSEPIKEVGNVATWKLRMITRPEQKDAPSQRINIDICSIPSYDTRPVMLRNNYDVDMGTSGLIIQAESREEILADKLIAFALRPNRLKNRDLWDIGWLKQQNVKLPLDLIPQKIADHHRLVDEYLSLLLERTKSLQNDPKIQTAFTHEMKRFLPQKIMQNTVENVDFWKYLTDAIDSETSRTIGYLNNPASSALHFPM